MNSSHYRLHMQGWMAVTRLNDGASCSLAHRTRDTQMSQLTPPSEPLKFFHRSHPTLCQLHQKSSVSARICTDVPECVVPSITGKLTESVKLCKFPSLQSQVQLYMLSKCQRPQMMTRTQLSRVYLEQSRRWVKYLFSVQLWYFYLLTDFQCSDTSYLYPQLQRQFFHNGQTVVTEPTTSVLTLCAQLDAFLRHGYCGCVCRSRISLYTGSIDTNAGHTVYALTCRIVKSHRDHGFWKYVKRFTRKPLVQQVGISLAYSIRCIRIHGFICVYFVCLYPILSA